MSTIQPATAATTAATATTTATSASWKRLALTVAFWAGLALAATADKNHEQLAGPKGGRILEKTEPRAEFYVEKDRTVTITFYDAKLKPIPAADQAVTLHVMPKGGKSILEFERKGDVLVSKGRLPEGDDYNVIVQFRTDAAARPQNFRFRLQLVTCGECRRAEYACTCDH